MPPISGCSPLTGRWRATPIEGVIEAVPTYRSLLVQYDPEQIDFDALSARLLALAQLPAEASSRMRRWRIPVAYGGEQGIDLEDVAKALGITPDDVVARHVGGNYRVAMIGFTPGWSYLSGLDKSLHMSRRQDPRVMTPAGTISIGGVQAGVQCIAGPSGWHLLGCTPVRTYQLHRNPTFLLEPGDYVTFSRIDARTYSELAASCRGRRDRRRIGRLMPKLVVASIGPASSVQDAGRPGSQRYGLASKRRDGSAVARGCQSARRQYADGCGDRTRPVRRGLHGARRADPRCAVRRAAQCRHRQDSRRVRCIDDDRRWRDVDARLCPQRLLQLSRDRRRHRGRSGVRQPVGQRAGRARQPLPATAAGRR